MERSFDRRGARREPLEDPIGRVVHPSIGPELREIPADQGQIVMFVQATDLADPVQRRFITDMAAERISGVGGIHHQAASGDDIRGLLQQPLLGMSGVDGKILAQGTAF